MDAQKNGRPLQKMGRSSDYGGGCVFRNLSIARYGLKKHFNEEFSIFVLQLPKPWDSCVDDSNESKTGYGLLLEDATIREEYNHRFLLKKL